MQKTVENLSVIILTYNEEKNLPQALRNVTGWAKDVFVVDSYSEDKTVEIAEDWGAHVVQNEFENYSAQRNFALRKLPIETDWIFFLDADEWLMEDLKREISSELKGEPQVEGFYAKRRFYWMGTWVKRGYYPVWLLRLVKHERARCEERPINEHLVVDGDTDRLENDFVDENQKGIGAWIDKHNRYAEMEAEELIRSEITDSDSKASLTGEQDERKRWVRQNIWNKLPPYVRPFIYFGYRFLIRGGVLDGKEASLYHFFQGFWFPMLIDAKYEEKKDEHSCIENENVDSSGLASRLKRYLFEKTSN